METGLLQYTSPCLNIFFLKRKTTLYINELILSWVIVEIPCCETVCVQIFETTCPESKGVVRSGGDLYKPALEFKTVCRQIKNMIITINKGGLEFKREYQDKLNQSFYFVGWRESVGPGLPIHMPEGFLFYKDIDIEDIDTRTNLGKLRAVNQTVFDEVIDDPAFSRILKSFLARHVDLKSALTGYFYRHYQFPRNRLSNDFFDIHLIADLNSQDDFILVNGILFTLQSAISGFFPLLNIRVFIFGPEIETDFIANIDQIAMLYRNINLFYLVRQYVSYKLHIILCHDSNDIAWRSAYHFLRFSVIDGVDKKDKAASIIIPFHITLPNDEEKGTVLHYAHDVGLAQLASSVSKKDNGDRKETGVYYNTPIENQLAELLKKEDKKIIKRFKASKSFFQFISLLREIVDQSLQSENSFIDMVKEDYVLERIDIPYIEKLRNEISQEHLKLKERSVDDYYQSAKARFIALKRALGERHFICLPVKRSAIPIKEIQGILEHYFRTASLKMYAEQLCEFLVRIRTLETNANDLMTEKDLPLEPGVIDSIVSIIREEYLSCLDIFQLRNDLCYNQDSLFYLSDEEKKAIFDRIDRLAISYALSKEPGPWKIVFSFWKAYCFPWSDISRFQALIFANQNRYLKYAKPFFTARGRCNTLRKEDFTNDYAFEDSKENILDVLCEEVGSDVKGIEIYLHMGFFPFETLLIKEYKDILRERVMKSRMLESLIRDTGHVEVMIPFERKLDLPVHDNASGIKGLTEFKHQIMSLDLPLLKKGLEEMTNEVDLHRHTLANFVNTLSRIEMLMDTSESE